MRPFVLVAVVLVPCLVAFPARTRAQARVVAEAGGREITAGDLAAYVQSRQYAFRFPTRSEAYRQALEDLVTDVLKRIDFFASGLDRREALFRDVQRTVTEELVRAYFEHRFQNAPLDEETIRAEYDAMSRAVAYRQIVLDKPPDAALSVLDSLRATIGRIQRQLDAGADFDALARRYARRGASASRATWEQTLVSPRDYALFSLSPGDVRSFEEPTRFSVARVERVERIPVPPLERVRDRIVEVLQARRAGAALRAFEAEKAAIVDTTALRWDAAALERFAAWSNTPGFYEGGYRTVVSQYLAEHDDAPLLSDGRGTVRLSDLPRLFDRVLILDSSGPHDVALLQDFLLEAVRTERLADRARALGLDAEILRADTPSPVLADLFVRLYDRVRIEDRIPEPTGAALRAFHAAHADSLFYQRALVNAEVITRTDPAEIEALRAEVQRGTPFEALPGRRLMRSFVRTEDGTIASYLSREPPYLGEIAFGLAKGEVAGPVAYEDAEGKRVHALLRVVERREARPLGFDEVEDRIAEAYVAYHRARRAADVAADLRARYPVTIHHDVLNELTAKS